MTSHRLRHFRVRAVTRLTDRGHPDVSRTLGRPDDLTMLEQLHAVTG
jgi:hypothetical protein